QWGPGPQEGEFKDRAGSMYALLRELSRGMDGLCLLSSRVDLTDIPLSDTSGPARRVNLDRLSTEAGRALLKHYNIKGLDSELDAAVEEYDGHALALVLLAEHLREFADGDIVKRDQVPLLDEETRPGEHAFRVMEAYDIALKRDGREPERAILRIIGLFDRPASQDCLDALRREPAIKGVTDSLIGLSDLDWRHAVGRLRKWRLLAQPRGQDDGSLDAHPLVREYFGPKLERESPEGFRQAHSRLYEHLRDTAKQLPDTLEEMEPLFQAVHHGCRATRYEEALGELYRDRVQRGSEMFNWCQLGGFSADATVLSAFFQDPWGDPSPHLSAAATGYLLNQTGADLVALGRLGEADKPLSISLRIAEQENDPNNASVSALNVAELHLVAGRLIDANNAIDKACLWADDFAEPVLRASVRAARGAILHRRSLLCRALGSFREAATIARQHGGTYKHLRGIYVAYYCHYLVNTGAAHRAKGEARKAIQSRSSEHAPEVLGLENLALARALYALACKPMSGNIHPARDAALCTADSHLHRALEHLRRSGFRPGLPGALLLRVAVACDLGEPKVAQRDLNEALELSTRIGLRLHETDARLLQGHMALDDSPPDVEAAQQSLGRAQQLVEETGYHLRDADLLILEGRLLAKQGDTIPGRTKLHDAITVARREEKDGCVYQLAVDQAERCLKELEQS
ncbi:MAG: hypothetical protein JSV79_10890, partial [Armatimonadota bacterium]